MLGATRSFAGLAWALGAWGQVACSGGDARAHVPAEASVDGAGDGLVDASPDAASAVEDAAREASWGDGEVTDGASDGAELDAGSTCDAATIAADRFVTRVVDFSPGSCAGFGQKRFPAVVEGPPIAGKGGSENGSLDVLSLGTGGSITLSFEPNAIVDGPGPDFLVFENPFAIGSFAANPNAELGEVSVSDDGTTWSTFPCTATSYPYGPCAGWHYVYSSPSNCISPLDPTAAGGDPFDLHDLGLTHARYVRIVDQGHQACPDGTIVANGFDLDAVSVVNAETR